jgi:hypothetical protein
MRLAGDAVVAKAWDVGSAGPSRAPAATKHKGTDQSTDARSLVTAFLLQTLDALAGA